MAAGQSPIWQGTESTENPWIEGWFSAKSLIGEEKPPTATPQYSTNPPYFSTNCIFAMFPPFFFFFF
jgi:hypothetical protein